MKSSNGSFWHCQVSGLAMPSCFSSPNIHDVDFTSFQPLRSQHSPSKLVFGLYSFLDSILYSNLCPPFRPPPPAQRENSIPYHPPNVSIRDTTTLIQPARFSILISGNFYRQQLVLGKLSNILKWSTFCASFICVLTILGWL